MQTRVGVRYLGRVQGVGFRATARATASGFRVSGWVRNEPDGSVLMEVQGDAAQVEVFLSALAERMARNIKSVQRTALAVSEGESSFEIRR
ncbi:MAG TPA: acylphosphatase [Phycisphaerales bacterium]|nr:acylphosphatase [Phycisphaerales bacterium]